MENVRGKNTKRKHLSKNKKKSWRKINTDDVDEFLEQERLQERTGGKAREKTNDALFFIDKIVKEPKKKFEGIQKRKRKAQDTLGDIEVTLKPPPPAKKEKRAPDVLAKLAKKQATATKRSTVTRKRVKKPTEIPEATFDLWSDDTKTEKEDLHYLRQTRKLQIPAPEHLKKAPSKQPKVKLPHPGASYNPAYDDHQDLLLKAHIVELEKLREEEKIRRALDDQFPTVADRPTEASKLKEMSAGLFDDDSEDDSEEDVEVDLDKISVNPPVRRDNKKNERQRKKEKRRKDEVKKRQEEKLRKMKDNNVFRLKAIKREIVAKEKLIAEKQQKRVEKEESDQYKTQRLGKMKFIEPDLDVQLTDDLVGTLRELKPEGDLLEDRFNSFQKRNMIAPRNQVKKRKKYKPKKFEKRGQGHLMKS